MLVVAAGLLALASAAPRECNTSGPRVQCKGHGLSAMPTTLDRKTTHLDLRQNDIRHLVLPATARHLRTRRDIEFTCEDGTAVSIQTAVDDGNGLEYGDVLTAYGDEDLSKTTDITTFPDAIACVTELYELNMWGNNLATIPALGTAGLNLVKLGIVDFGSNQINTIAANTFTGLTEMKQLRLDNNQIPSIPAGLFTSEHAALQHVLISDNYIARMPYRLFTGTKCTDTTFDMARNVLKCDSYVSKGADPCKCDQSHAQYPSGATAYDVIPSVTRACAVTATPQSLLADLNTQLDGFEADMDQIEASFAKVDVLETDMADIKTSVDEIHANMDLSGCPKTRMRFTRGLN